MPTPRFEPVLLRPVLGSLGVALLAVWAAGVVTVALSGSAREDWRAYSADVVARRAALEDAKAAFGYGGLIHHLKNAVLRGGEHPAQAAACAARVEAALDRYLALGATPAERADLETIRLTARRYGGLGQVTGALRRAGASSVAVDRQVRVDDGPALAAFAQLEAFHAARVERQGAALERQLDAATFGGLLAWLLVQALLIALLVRSWQAVQRAREAEAERAASAAALAEAHGAVEDHAAALEAKNQELNEFTNIVSHDLQEPLRGIRLLSQFLEEDLAAQLDADGKRRLGQIRDRCGRVQHMIDDLLTCSRAGRARMEQEEVSLEELLDELLDDLRPSLEEAGIEVRRPAPLPALTCDRVWVAEALRNLLGNAVKFTRGAGSWIEVGARADGAVYVADDGPGIATKDQERVFGIFQRLEHRTAADGSGSGLTIVRKIAERHGGRAWVESNLGVGSTFWFTLAPDAAEATARRAA